MKHRFVLLLRHNAPGCIQAVSLLDNRRSKVFDIPVDTLPRFIHERLALIKITEVQPIGAILPNGLNMLFLSKDEFAQMKPGIPGNMKRRIHTTVGTRHET